MDKIIKLILFLKAACFMHIYSLKNGSSAITPLFGWLINLIVYMTAKSFYLICNHLNM